MTKTYILRGHKGWPHRRFRCDPRDHPQIKVTRPKKFDLAAWAAPGPTVSDVVIEADIYERFEFTGPGGRRLWRYYHKDHPEYYLLKTGKWNQWWQEKINRHTNWRRGAGIDKGSYHKLVLAAMIRCVEDIN